MFYSRPPLMTLYVLGINHKTAPIEMRERINFASDTLGDVLYSIIQLFSVEGVVILSTCNRTELYLSIRCADGLQDKLVQWLCDYHNVTDVELKKSVYCYQDRAVVNHLMRVASGLDSLILGESQILGQVKKAFTLSQQHCTMSAELERLFQKTFSAAKRIRTETEIGNHTLSVAFAACSLARKFFDSLSDITVMLVGAGETIRLVARHLHKHQIKRLVIANRTVENASLLTKEMDLEVISLDCLEGYLTEVDIVISSTASSLPIITRASVERGLSIRKYRPMLFIDLAVPRDIEPDVGELDNIYLYNIDDLQDIIRHNMAQRQVAAAKAENIIQQEEMHFIAWLRQQEVKENIIDYRALAEKIRKEIELKALRSLQRGEPPEKIIHELSYRLTNRLIHTPTKLLQHAASEGSPEQLQLLRNSLFD